MGLGCAVSNIIKIVPYDPAWPAQFKIVAAPLREALGDLALRIDHIGSTAVPGLAAKDRIDVQVTIRHFDCTPQVVAALGLLGYTHIKEFTCDHRPLLAQGPDTDWEKLFFRSPASQRPTNL